MFFDCVKMPQVTSVFESIYLALQFYNLFVLLRNNIVNFGLDVEFGFAFCYRNMV